MIYFDNAATTLHKPKEVIDAVVFAMESMGNAGRGSNSASINASRSLYNARVNVANFFNISVASRLAFTHNSTESLNIAIKGLFSKDDHVISTALEHNSVLRPLYEIQNSGVDISIIPADTSGNLDYSNIPSYIKSNTKAII